jgi:hypothetical protein
MVRQWADRVKLLPQNGLERPQFLSGGWSDFGHPSS